MELFALSLILFLVLSAFLFLAFEAYVIFIGHIYGAPFVATDRKRLKTMFEFANIKPGEMVVDFGSGSGTLIVAAARLGARVVGIEINPFLVFFSRWVVRREKLQGNIKIIRGDFRKYTINEIDVLFLYLWPSTLDRLREKLLSELNPGARIVSNAFEIKGMRPVLAKDGVYLYKIPGF